MANDVAAWHSACSRFVWLTTVEEFSNRELALRLMLGALAVSLAPTSAKALNVWLTIARLILLNFNNFKALINRGRCRCSCPTQYTHDQ